jgi:NAD(P)-dependent dehydrogenase (short-subunit alcohol dehydrogenase family)
VTDREARNGGIVAGNAENVGCAVAEEVCQYGKRVVLLDDEQEAAA